jgi:hypothetical protein
MLGISLSMLLAVAPPQPSTVAGCGSYVGKTVKPLSFEELRRSLPSVADKGAYETTADYEKRKATAAPLDLQPVFLRQALGGNGLRFEADKGEVTIWPPALGVGQVNFSNVFGYGGMKNTNDNYSSAIGFLIQAKTVSSETVEATNGFGARFQVAKTLRDVEAVWERAGRRGHGVFIDVKPFQPVATVSMSAQGAKDLIEAGSSALLLTPVPPYSKAGKSVLEATFASPRERVDSITVLIADIHCSVLLNSTDTVVAAFTVR